MGGPLAANALLFAAIAVYPGSVGALTPPLLAEPHAVILQLTQVFLIMLENYFPRQMKQKFVVTNQEDSVLMSKVADVNHVRVTELFKLR